MLRSTFFYILDTYLEFLYVFFFHVTCAINAINFSLNLWNVFFNIMQSEFRGEVFLYWKCKNICHNLLKLFINLMKFFINLIRYSEINLKKIFQKFYLFLNVDKNMIMGSVIIEINPLILICFFFVLGSFWCLSKKKKKIVLVRHSMLSYNQYLPDIILVPLPATSSILWEILTILSFLDSPMKHCWLNIKKNMKQ